MTVCMRACDILLQCVGVIPPPSPPPPPGVQVIASLTQVRDLLTAPSNLRVYMSGDVRRAAAGGSALQPWEPLISRARG